MAYYYKINDCDYKESSFKGFHCEKFKQKENSCPKINFDFSCHVLIELLDDVTPERELWKELKLTSNKSIIHKRMMIDSHRIKCRRAIVICNDSCEAKLLAERLSQAIIMKRNICAIVIEDLLSDLCLFEKQIIQFGDAKPQQQLLYVSDLNRCMEPLGLVRFLKEKFSQFGTIMSVFVCADDDGYAYPEGIIKFSYLSEAFAAELALDQFVVGKDKLSVTAHHNILLSQCDLRLRLRNAQYNNFTEYNSLTEPHFQYQSYELKSVYEDCLVNTFDKCQISSEENSSEKDLNTCDCQSNTSRSVTKQHNSKLNIQLNQCENSSECFTENSKCSKNGENIDIRSVSTNKNSFSEANKSAVVPKHRLQNLDYIKNKRAISTIPENTSIPKKLAKNIKKTFSYENMPDFKSVDEMELTNLTYCTSNTHEQTLCNNSAHLSCDNPILSAMELTCESFAVRSQSISLNKEQVNSMDRGTTKDADTIRLSPKHATKRKKRFTPSQRLCLKSQRTALSQRDLQNPSIKNSNSNFCSSQPQEISINKGINISTEYVNSIPYDSQQPSKVHEWLLQLPNPQNAKIKEGTKEKYLEMNKESNSNSNQHLRRISVYATPSLRRQTTFDFKKLEHSYARKNNVENEDPNESTEILHDGNSCVPIMMSKSPLQTWLKHELSFSINNSVTTSQDMSKSIIVCATKTKDVAISVGCSHMLCDHCYPNSTNLLLGYC